MAAACAHQVKTGLGPWIDTTGRHNSTKPHCRRNSAFGLLSPAGSPQTCAGSIPQSPSKLSSLSLSGCIALMHRARSKGELHLLPGDTGHGSHVISMEGGWAQGQFPCCAWRVLLPPPPPTAHPMWQPTPSVLLGVFPHVAISVSSCLIMLSSVVTMLSHVA